MRPRVLLSSLVVVSAVGCHHAPRVKDSYAPTTVVAGPVASEERTSPTPEERAPATLPEPGAAQPSGPTPGAPMPGAPMPGAPMPGAPMPGAPCPPGVACPPGVTYAPGAAPPPTSFLHKCGQLLGLKEPCRRPEIHVNVPPPKVIIRREEKPTVRTPPAVPRPGNEVMLVPTTVYVPYARVNPTGPATMTLNVPPPEPAAVPCAPPPGGACPPGAPACGTQPPGGPTEAQTIDALNRRCAALENKIDALVEALKARPNR